MIDASWLLPELAIGARLDHEAIHAARDLGIRRIVDLRSECCDDEAFLAHVGIELLHLPTDDHAPIAPEHLARGVAWVRDAVTRGEKVLVHCEHGIGRSALLVLCVLVSLARSPSEALELAKRARPKVSPSPAQLLAFIAFCEAHGHSIVFDELARVAYRAA